MQTTAFCLTPVLPKLFRPRDGNDSAIQGPFEPDFWDFNAN